MRLPNTAHTSRPGASKSSPATSVSMTCGRCRRREAPTTSPGWCGRLPRATRRMAPPAPAERSGRSGGRSGAAPDSPDAGLGSRVPTLRDRLPADLRDAPSGPDFPRFNSLYLLDDEWAAEIANRTVHGFMHVGWVPDGSGGYRGQMAVLVKPNGVFGAAYMAAIAPFRHLIVYPPLMREIGREWRKPTYEPRRADVH
jgi:hypothetical protein